MENIQNQGNQNLAMPNADELKEEQETLKVPTLEEIKTKVVEETGLDPEANVELVEKLAQKELSHKETLSKAIGQKIKHRESFAEYLKKNPPKEVDKSSQSVQPKQLSDEDIDKRVDERFEERDLTSMDLSDELKSEVKAYAKAKGISYREAVKSDYFNFVKGKEDERIKAEEASASTKGTTIKAKRDFGNLSESEITKLPDDEFKEYKAWLKTQG